MRSKELSASSVAVCALAMILASCEKPPPLRALPPLGPDPIRSQADLEIGDATSILYFLTPDLSSSLNAEMEAAIDSVRQAEKRDGDAQIKTALHKLSDYDSGLEDLRNRFDTAKEFLAALRRELNPSLRQELVAAVKVVHQAMKGTSWAAVKAKSQALKDLTDRLALADERIAAANELLGLDWPNRMLFPLSSLFPPNPIPSDRKFHSSSGLGPVPRRKLNVSIDRLKEAARTLGWEAIATRAQELEDVRSTLSGAQELIKDGEQIARNLQSPQDQHLMLAGTTSLREALKHGSWQEICDRSKVADGLVGRFAGVAGRGPMLCVRVLVIDGGGIRGIIPAMLLADIERRTKTPIYKLFDLIVGTSTGGILALGLTKPDPTDPNTPAYTAEDMVKFYQAEGPRIFRRHLFQSVRELFAPKYSSDGIENALDRKLGTTLFGATLTNVVVPAYDIEEHRHFFFNSYDTRTSRVPMSAIAQAASAAPTYFHPVRVPLDPGSGRNYVALVDGGVFANNPEAYAISIVTKYEYYMRQKPHDMKHPLFVLSLGTGAVPPSTSFEKAFRWGLLGWTRPLVDIMLSDPGVEDEAEDLVPYGDNIVRFQPELTRAEDSLDDASQANIQSLQGIANSFILAKEPNLEWLAGLLMEDRPKECPCGVGQWNSPRAVRH